MAPLQLRAICSCTKEVAHRHKQSTYQTATRESRNFVSGMSGLCSVCVEVVRKFERNGRFNLHTARVKNKLLPPQKPSWARVLKEIENSPIIDVTKHESILATIYGGTARAELTNLVHY